MKRIATYCLCILTAVCLLTGCKSRHSNGETIKVSLLTGVEQFGSNSDSAFRRIELQYNDFGMVTERLENRQVVMESFYDREGTLLRRTYPERDRTETYDAQGNLLTIQWGDKLRECTYDSAGNVLTDKTVEAGEVTYQSSSTHEYNENGLLVRSVTKTLDHEFEYLYRYDAEGRLVYWCVINEKGDENTICYQYDKNGNMTMKEYISGTGGREVQTITYNAQGKVVKDVYQMSAFTQTIVKAYDDIGNLLKTEVYQDDVRMSTTEYEYSDIAGQILSVSMENRHSKTYENFTYDENGNMLTREFTDGFGRSSKYVFAYTTASVPATFADAVQSEQESLRNEIVDADTQNVSN